ncbi:MAG: hypothetical protein AAFO89_01860 [Planctomycetota bacterium]
MNRPDDWIQRIEGLGRLSLVDDDAVRAVAASPLGRRTTRNLLAFVLLDEPVSVETDQITALDDRLLAAAGGLLPDPQPPSTDGPIQTRSRDDVIELWTERELTIVHAGWLLPRWCAAAVSSARWLIEEIQPDNATNLPWAVHVFASLFIDEGIEEARMYAETLMHNCVVTTGRPDDLSALILLDAARQLRVRYTV